MDTNRRDAMTCLAGVLGTAAIGKLATAEERPDASDPPPTAIAVTDYGAVGDGKNDDTPAFEKVLQAAANAGGAIAFVPPGRYRLTRPLEVPDSVTLEGAQRSSPPRNLAGSIILADIPPGDENGPSFINLRTRSTLCGLCITYPQQDDPANIKPFPWCVRSLGDNASIINCLLHNPYQAVDFGTRVSGRHLIDGLHGQPLKHGLLIDNCFDVGRVRNVHFWPFWSNEAREFMETEGTAFTIGRTDWQFMDSCFCIWYRVGFHFVANRNGGGNAVITNSGTDIGPTAVRVEQVQKHSGVSFVNGQFMSGIEVGESNTGPVKFTACGFWGVNERDLHCESHATLHGSGQISFDNCHFTMWDLKNNGAPAIAADCEGVAVRNCDFVDAGKQQIQIGRNVKSAVICGNRLRGGVRIEAESNENFAIGLNSPC